MQHPRYCASLAFKIVLQLLNHQAVIKYKPAKDSFFYILLVGPPDMVQLIARMITQLEEHQITIEM